MLMPQELRKYAFNHAIRGYSTAEVDEYIEFLCEKYEEVYRENDELERKLEAALRTLDEVKSRENKITALDAEVKRVSARMLAQAEAQKKRIVTDAEEYADRIIADADAHVAEQAQVLESMRQSVLAFRDDLYARYSRQIDEIEAFAAAAQTVSGMHVLPDADAETEPAIAAEAADAPDEAAEPETPAEPEETAEAEEESLESLFAPTEEERAAAESDEIDEDELAETDEALLFFETITPAAADEEAGDGYAQVDENAYAQAQEHKAETEFSYDESDADAEEDGAADDFEALLPVIEELPAEDASTEEAEEESTEEAAAEPAEADSDEDLLRDLRQAFNIQFETFTTETADGAADDGESFAFLEEPEEEEEPLSLLERLKSAMEKEKPADKKETKEKETHR